jgi:hypothetical protein
VELKRKEKKMQSGAEAAQMEISMPAMYFLKPLHSSRTKEYRSNKRINDLELLASPTASWGWFQKQI